jgi:hypothetical protein
VEKRRALVIEKLDEARKRRKRPAARGIEGLE